MNLSNSNSVSAPFYPIGVIASPVLLPPYRSVIFLILALLYWGAGNRLIRLFDDSLMSIFEIACPFLSLKLTWLPLGCKKLLF